MAASHSDVAEVLKKQGRYEEAIAYYKVALEEMDTIAEVDCASPVPLLATYHNNLASCFKNLGHRCLPAWDARWDCVGLYGALRGHAARVSSVVYSAKCGARAPPPPLCPLTHSSWDACRRCQALLASGGALQERAAHPRGAAGARACGRGHVQAQPRRHAADHAQVRGGAWDGFPAARTDIGRVARRRGRVCRRRFDEAHTLATSALGIRQAQLGPHQAVTKLSQTLVERLNTDIHREQAAAR